MDTRRGSRRVKYFGNPGEAMYLSVLGSKCAITCVSLCVPCSGLFLECHVVWGSTTMVRVFGCVLAAIRAWWIAVSAFFWSGGWAKP
jgi:hypothetical protein